MNFSRYRSITLGLTTSIFLSAGLVNCGGGGGGSTSVPPVVVEPAPPTPADTTPPTITLSGEAEMRVEQGSEFTDPGASANDETDGEVTVSVSGTVDVATADTYTLIYSATDAAGNESTVERVVTVSDTTPPTVTLNGSGSMTLESDAAYAEAGAV